MAYGQSDEPREGEFFSVSASRSQISSLSLLAREVSHWPNRGQGCRSSTMTVSLNGLSPLGRIFPPPMRAVIAATAHGFAVWRNASLKALR
jgi:hypothetical protein